MLAPAPDTDVKTHNKPVRCRHCGVAGWALHRSPETNHEWKKWPAIQRADGLYVADLSQPMHVCEKREAPFVPAPLTVAPKVSRIAPVVVADPEASAWEATTEPATQGTSDDVASLVRTLGVLVRLLESKLNAGKL